MAKLYSVAEASEITGICLRSIRMYCKQLGCARAGARTYLITEAQLAKMKVPRKAGRPRKKGVHSAGKCLVFIGEAKATKATIKSWVRMAKK